MLRIFILLFLFLTAYSSANPLTNGLVAWFKADTGVSTTFDGTNNRVDFWADQSGQNLFATGGVSASGATRPILVDGVVNGLPALRFDGTSSADLSGNFKDLTNATVFAITKYQSANNNDYTYAFGINGPTGSQMTFSRLNDSQVKHFDGAANHVVSLPIETEFSYLTQTYDNSSGTGVQTAFRDGVQFMSTSLAGGATYSVNSSDSFFIGSWSDSTFNFKGDMVEFIVYDRALSTGEQLQVEAYLEARLNGTPVPEPSTLICLFSALLLMVCRKR